MLDWKENTFLSSANGSTMLCDAGNPPPDSDGHDVITTLSEEVALAQAAEFCSLTSVFQVTSRTSCTGGRQACEGMTQGNLDKIQTVQIVGTMLTLVTVGDHWWSFTKAWKGGGGNGWVQVRG